jgi:hypothetical protein
VRFNQIFWELGRGVARGFRDGEGLERGGWFERVARVELRRRLEVVGSIVLRWETRGWWLIVL